MWIGGMQVCGGARVIWCENEEELGVGAPQRCDRRRFGSEVVAPVLTGTPGLPSGIGPRKGMELVAGKGEKVLRVDVCRKGARGNSSQGFFGFLIAGATPKNC